MLPYVKLITYLLYFIHTILFPSLKGKEGPQAMAPKGAPSWGRGPVGCTALSPWPLRVHCPQAGALQGSHTALKSRPRRVHCPQVWVPKGAPPLGRCPAGFAALRPGPATHTTKVNCHVLRFAQEWGFIKRRRTIPPTSVKLGRDWTWRLPSIPVLDQRRYRCLRWAGLGSTLLIDCCEVGREIYHNNACPIRDISSILLSLSGSSTWQHSIIIVNHLRN